MIWRIKSKEGVKHKWQSKYCMKTEAKILNVSQYHLKFRQQNYAKNISACSNLLSSSKELGQRLLWNIGLVLRKLWVFVCLHSRCLMICKHGLFTTNRWDICPWNMLDTRLFTNSKVSVMELYNNLQFT